MPGTRPGMTAVGPVSSGAVSRAQSLQPRLLGDGALDGFHELGRRRFVAGNQRFPRLKKALETGEYLWPAHLPASEDIAWHIPGVGFGHGHANGVAGRHD